MNRGTESFLLSGRELQTLSLSQPHEFWGIKEQENARKSKIPKTVQRKRGPAKGKTREMGCSCSGHLPQRP